MKTRPIALASALLLGGLALRAAVTLTAVSDKEAVLATASVDVYSEIRFTPQGVEVSGPDAKTIPYKGLAWLRFPGSGSSVGTLAADQGVLALSNGSIVFSGTLPEKGTLTVADPAGRILLSVDAWEGETIDVSSLPAGPVVVAAPGLSAKFILK